ncbi:MAG TPA: tetratricopeptide repeat protein [Nitrososphaeraceae archaeon]|nr:tetratricopeptide repeat protein [Nitrososphaeraceae archaeon]
MNTPISINGVGGNVTVTIIDGSNNKTDIRIDDFENSFPQECGLTFLYNDPYRKDSSNTSTHFSDWVKGFQFNIKSVYYEREYRREGLLNKIKTKLEQDQRLLLLGESGTSKSIILMEILCDYLKLDYKILHNLDPVSIGNSSGEIKNIQYIENTILKLVEAKKNVIVLVDDVHNKTISDIFSVMKRIRDYNEDIFKKITFLLSARQPDFEQAMTGGGIFHAETKDRIDLLFDDPKREPIPYFSQEEVKGFIEKYREYWDSSLRNKSIDENAQAIFNDTKGHPIMVRFSVLKNGLKNHVRQMYQDWLLTKDNSLNIERIKSVIACSLYHISSIPLNDKTLSVDLGLEEPSYELDKTIIKIEGNVWTTIHPRWDLELFNYLFSLNVHIRKIQRAFSFILNKILDINSGSGTWNQLLILDTVYSTIAAKKFVDIKFIQEMIKEDDIEKKIDHFFKPEFFNIIGFAYNKLEYRNYAIVCCDKAIEINPQYVNAYINKGIALFVLVRNEEAIKCYDKAIEIDPHVSMSYYLKGRILLAVGRYEEAIVCCDKAIEIDPYDTMSYYNKGNALSALGRYEEAIDYYDKAIAINSQDAEAYYYKGVILSILGRNEEAIVCCDKAIEINPQYALAYYYKGAALSDLGRYEEAIVCYDKTIEINPQDADAHLARGIALSTLGRKEEAIACFDKTIEINPQDASAYYNKGIVLSVLGRYEEAIVCDDKSLTIDPNYSDALNGKAFALANLGKNEEALPLIEKALESDSNNEYYLSTAAFIMYNLGKYDEAKNYYNKALDINPNLKDTLSESELKAFNSVME